MGATQASSSTASEDRLFLPAPQPLRSFAVERVRLAEGLQCPLKNATHYMNMARYEPRFAEHYRKVIYVERIAQIEPIELVRLEAATLYPNGEDYIVDAGEGIVEEQLPPWFQRGAQVSINTPLAREEISGETLIVARYGACTWGHWLAELLPKIVMAEAAFPNRFLYTVPEAYSALHMQNFIDAISAYGVSRQRLILLNSRRAYLLRKAWAVTSIWSDHVMHPAAAEMLRSRGPRAQDARTHKIALLRPPDATRKLENWTEISGVLTDRGYPVIEIASLSFVAQVEVFRSATHIYSTLGSTLTGLIYSPPGLSVVSVAPAIFGDRFFYALIAERRGRYADVRGPIEKAHREVPHRGSFVIDPADLIEALAVVA